MDDSLNQAVIGDYLNIGHWSTRGLVGYWPFARAENLIDFTLNRRHGAITGATWVGDGLFFDSTGEVNIGTAFNGLPTTYNFTIILWAKADSYISVGAAFGLNGPDDLVLYPYDGPGQFRVFWRNIGSGSLFSIGHSLAGTGYHQFVFASYAANDHRAFLDGVQIGTSSDTGTAGPFTDDAFIGAFFSGSQNFHGSIRSVSICSRALSASEIMQLFMNPNLPIQREPIWWGQAAAVVGVNPKGPLGHPLYGPFAGPVAV